MKHLTLTLLFFIFSFFGFSQNNEPKLAESKVYAEQISDNHYAVVFLYENSKQTGEFLEMDGKFLRHGTWKLFTNKRKTMSGKFDNGELLSLTIYDAGDKITYTKRDIEFFKLKRRIYKLENMISVQY